MENSNVGLKINNALKTYILKVRRNTKENEIKRKQEENVSLKYRLFLFDL